MTKTVNPEVTPTIAKKRGKFKNLQCNYQIGKVTRKVDVVDPFILNSVGQHQGINDPRFQWGLFRQSREVAGQEGIVHHLVVGFGLILIGGVRGIAKDSSRIRGVRRVDGESLLLLAQSGKKQLRFGWQSMLLLDVSWVLFKVEKIVEVGQGKVVAGQCLW